VIASPQSDSAESPAGLAEDGRRTVASGEFRFEWLRQLADDLIHEANCSPELALRILVDYANQFINPVLPEGALREIVEAAGKELPQRAVVPPSPVVSFRDAFASLERQIAIKNAAGLGIQGDRRQAFLVALGTELLRGGAPAVEVLDELREVNRGRCAEPLPDEDVDRIVADAVEDEIHRLHRLGAEAAA
jgi:hypothetical protein